MFKEPSFVRVGPKSGLSVSGTRKPGAFSIPLGVVPSRRKTTKRTLRTTTLVQWILTYVTRRQTAPFFSTYTLYCLRDSKRHVRAKRKGRVDNRMSSCCRFAVGSKWMSSGAGMGKGIYMADQLSVSFGYAGGRGGGGSGHWPQSATATGRNPVIVAVCEVINRWAVRRSLERYHPRTRR